MKYYDIYITLSDHLSAHILLPFRLINCQKAVVMCQYYVHNIDVWIQNSLTRMDVMYWL